MRTEINKIEAVYTEHSPRLLSFIRSQVNCHEDAEDILHDVFYKLSRATNDGTSEIERMSSWLYRVAKNMILNFWRKKREIPLDTEDAVCEDLSYTLFCAYEDIPDIVLLRKLVWQELDAALSDLPPEQREVFCLTVFDNIPVKDISAATGTPVATLLSRKHYAVKHLRNRLHDLYDALMKQ